MTGEVRARDRDGNPTVVIFQETPEQRARRESASREQEARARDVARSLTIQTHETKRSATVMLSLISAFIAKLVAKLGLPKPVQDVVVHVVVVFAAAFVAQLGGASLGHFDWPAVYALAASAVTAGLSAAGHYLAGLIPTPPPVVVPVPPAKKAAK